MSSNRPRSIASLLDTEPTQIINRLAEQQSENHTIFHEVKSILPPKFAQNISSVIRRNDALVIIASNAAWANLIRYHSLKIIEKVTALASEKKEFADFTTINKVVVRTTPE